MLLSVGKGLGAANQALSFNPLDFIIVSGRILDGLGVHQSSGLFRCKDV